MSKAAGGLDDPGDDGAVLDLAWPEGVAAEDATLFRRLPLARRRKVVARLRALLAIEAIRSDNAVARIDMHARAREAGLTPDGLFAIRRKWEAERRLSSVVPYLGRAERQPTQRGEDDPVVQAAAALLLERAGEPDSVLAAELRRGFGASLPNMIRLVRRLRRDDATDPDRIGSTFGRAVLVDLCAIDAVTDGDPPEPVVCAMVVERAAGLVLGFAVAASGGDTIAAQVAAVTGAIAFLGANALDVEAGGEGAAVELTIGDGPALDRAFAAADASRAAGIDVRANSRGPRRYGQRLVSLLGKRLGGVWWRPRTTAPGSTPSSADHGAAISLDGAAASIEVAVRDHNRETLARLAEGGIAAGGGATSAAMVRSLRRVLDILSA